MGAALFDLDRTLLDCNSGRLWVAHEWREGRIGWRDAAWAAWWLTRYTLGNAHGLEEVFATAVASYEGIAEDEIVERTRSWFVAEVEPRMRPGARDALERHREAGDRLVLATSSTIYSARAAQEAWGFDDLICTHMEVEDGRFTGRISALAYGDAKLDRCIEWAADQGFELADCTFYTDSITDQRLLEAVGRPVAVNPDVKLARLATERSWPTVDWGRS
ncbi:MAG: HAD-IB family hydrolase [Alphaproteobacteria bacterium]|nr:HAD-IB family hydrolase [Alphaproteobacteria bacterium]